MDSIMDPESKLFIVFIQVVDCDHVFAGCHFYPRNLSYHTNPVTA